MSNIRYNKSKTYLLPLLSELVEFDSRFFNNLTNTYISDDTYKYKDCLYILHDFSFKNPEFTAYEHKLTKSDYFVDLIDINDKVLYIFKFPDEYMPEYEKFIQGKYSEYGLDAKELILQFWTNVYQNNPGAVNFLVTIKQVLFKDERLKKQIEGKLKVKLDKDAELSDIMEIRDETFNLSEYIKQEENKE